MLFLRHNNCGPEGLQLSRLFNQTVEMPVLRNEQLRNLTVIERDLQQRGQHFGHAFSDRIAVLAGHGGVERHLIALLLFPDPDLDGQFVAQVRAVEEL